MSLWDFIRPEHIVELLLVMVRVGGVFMLAPLFSNVAVPRQVKVVVVIMISLLLAPIVHGPLIKSNVNEVGLIVMVLTEMTIGLVIGFACNIIFLTVQAAGEFFGAQVGFNIATIIDPANEGSSGALASLYTMMGALIFLYLNGHHVILASLAKSFQILPLTQGFDVKFGYSVTPLVGYLFMTAIQISAPIIVVLTILQVIMGLITKIAPQMNIYMNAGLILGPILGMIILMITLPLFRVLMTTMTGQVEPHVIQVLKGLKGI